MDPGLDTESKHMKQGMDVSREKQAREEAGITQEELAARLHTKKTAISRIENHAEDIKLSTLEKFVQALGKHLKLEVA